VSFIDPLSFNPRRSPARSPARFRPSATRLVTACRFRPISRCRRTATARLCHWWYCRTAVRRAATGRTSTGGHSFSPPGVTRYCSRSFAAPPALAISFASPGRREWGALMQSDLTDGVKYLIEQGGRYAPRLHRRCELRRVRRARRRGIHAGSLRLRRERQRHIQPCGDAAMARVA
jgi:hypothetical protein